jgi:PAS domain S-box-containing protein
VTLLVAAGFAISRQLAARSNAEGELRNREHELFQMLEAMPVGVFVIDGSGRTYYTNARSRDLLGKGNTGAAAHDLAETYHAYRAGTSDLYPSDALPVVRALRGETVQVADVEIHRPDRVVPLEVWAAPVRDAAGTISYAIAAFGDMTERERQRRELEALNKELETFSYSVSHDLRSPLRAIDGFSRMLLEDYGSTLDAEGRRLLDVVRSSTQRMGRLIDDLLAFSKFSRREMYLGPVDMAALARGAIEDLRQAGGDGRGSVTIGELPAARGDTSLLRQVWANLLGNAVKYSRAASSPQVDVSAEQRGSMIEYRVRDNGVGFDMAYAGKLFGVFQRLHKAEEFEGTGVGLATVQRIVHRHGGRVWAESQVGQGATFYFTLPAGA